MSTSGGARFPATIPVTVVDGGTGLATLGANGVLIGEGTGNVNVTAVGNAGQVLTSNGTGNDPTFQAVSSGGGLTLFGDGSDGAQTFDGIATILGVAPSTNVYTMTRDWFLASSTINSGVTIKPNGYRIYVLGTLTNNGTISGDGPNAASATGGASFPNASGSLSVNSSFGGGGANGATTNGSNASSSTECFGASGGNGGHGATTNTGGNGATATQIAVTRGSLRGFGGLLGYLPIPGAGGGIIAINGGQGGGGGGGDGSNSGGGGGAGGIGLWIAVQTFAGTGAIHARGGNGFTPVAGVCGGGGGGGGGWIVVISSSVSAGAITGQTIDCNGGNGGTAIGGGNATNGVNGTAGKVVLLHN